MSILVHENFLRYPKKLRAIIGKDFIISAHDTSLVKYRVYNRMYKNVYTRPLVDDSPEKYRGSQPVNNNFLWFYCSEAAAHRPNACTRKRFKRIRTRTYKRDYMCSCVYFSDDADFSSLYVTTDVLCVRILLRPGTPDEQYVKKRISIIILLDPIWMNNSIIHTFKNEIIQFSFL